MVTCQTGRSDSICCRRLLKSVRMVACVVWLSLLGAMLTVLPG